MKVTNTSDALFQLLPSSIFYMLVRTEFLRINLDLLCLLLVCDHCAKLTTWRRKHEAVQQKHVKATGLYRTGRCDNPSS